MSRVPRIMSIVLFVIVVNVFTFWLFSPSPEAIPLRPGPEAKFQPIPLPLNPFGTGADAELEMLTVPSLVSLEMRENVDFLLTPALIVQGTITEGAIVSYPEE